ncbi:hypothetical protein OIU79_023812 [Salix purpurea]|uniref:Uncharacterized protein n=1 Tax=Salix purpurea TaxID=77065 RepID=A0A9Q0WAR3_SALPP|nr:hypothetical protein OIU79_023812 [Salix purpurea]
MSRTRSRGVAVLVAVAYTRVRHKVGTGNKGTTHKVVTSNKGITLKVSARKGLLTISRTRSRGSGSGHDGVSGLGDGGGGGGGTRVRHKVGMGNKGTTLKMSAREGFVDNIKDKIPGGVGAVLVVMACIRVSARKGLLTISRTRSQGGGGGNVGGNKGTTHKVGTGNKGTMPKVNARKGLLTISKDKIPGWWRW